MTNPPPGMYPPQQPLYAQQLLSGWENRAQGGDASIGDAFDFSFDRYATPAVVKVVYALTVVTCVMTYLGSVLAAFVLFAPDHTIAGIATMPGTPWPGIVTLALGWIPALLCVLVTRSKCEHALAGVRTAIDMRALRSRYVGPIYD